MDAMAGVPQALGFAALPPSFSVAPGFFGTGIVRCVAIVSVRCGLDN